MTEIQSPQPAPLSDFDAKVKAAAEHAVLKFIGEGGWLMPNYEARLKLPAEWMAQAWALVDRDALLRKFAERIESEMVDRMVNHMASELTTDIKQILSVQERREALRSLAREHMTAIMGSTGKKA
ncbi:MAG: hypothetical protein RL758_147 [Pseudomonadota bacterium]|jgi:hypothetical protein